MQKTSPTMGFLTVISVDETGWIGGYLLLNLRGRPLEFCCTTPVMPDRAQQILYGRTLRSFLLGEHIAPAILKQAKLRPTVTFTDVSEVLDARSLVDTPLVHLIRTDTLSERAIPADWFVLDEFRLRCHADFAADREIVTHVYQQTHSQFGLAEPFQRIRDAVSEAQRGAAA